MREVVRLPVGEHMNDWLAVHGEWGRRGDIVPYDSHHLLSIYSLPVVDFFNRINLIYGTVSDYCNELSCKTMSGGPRYEYLWADGETYKKPTQLPAPRYIELLMDWTESQINNEHIFPVTTDVPFPKTFPTLCRKILTRLFRVFVHVYIHHFDRIVSIGAEAHVNTCYKHFYYFVQEFQLVTAKELEPLSQMTSRICRD